MKRRISQPRVSDILVTVGKRLRAIREMLGETQEDVADMLGVDQSTYSKWEHGKRVPDIVTMTIFARRFKTSLDFIFLGEPGQMHPELTALLRGKYPDLMAAPPAHTASDMDTALASYRAAIDLQTAV